VKPEAFEKKWRLTVGEADTNPNPALWEQVERWITTTDRPPNSFTLTELCDRFNLSPQAGRLRLLRLLKHGKVVKLGRYGKSIYYSIAPASDDKKRAGRSPARARGAGDH